MARRSVYFLHDLNVQKRTQNNQAEGPEVTVENRSFLFISSIMATHDKIIQKMKIASFLGPKDCERGTRKFSREQ
jgi:hypothetical protein